jgi:uncharacterized protein YndB with AHSA1/START domain
MLVGAVAARRTGRRRGTVNGRSWIPVSTSYDWPVSQPGGDGMDNPTAQSTVEIAAPAELVYDLVTDVVDLPRWAAETARCRWLGGATEAAVGARFRGQNRNRHRRWSTTCKVIAADPGRRFAFQVHVAGYPTAVWEYEIEPTGSGCRVTESTRRLIPKVPAKLVNRLLGVSDRDAHNQRNIEQTLGSLKRYAEAGAAADGA